MRCHYPCRCAHIALGLLGLTLFGPSAVAVAQVQVVAADTLTTAVDAAIEEGRELEAERRWGEALTHYEDALRRLPSDPRLEERRELTRIHYDLSRRYGDLSFCDCLRTLTERDAVELYGEVLAKIQAHYYDEPNWRRIVDSGTRALAEALADPGFLSKNLPEATVEETQSALREVRESLARRQVNSRREALDAVASACSRIKTELGLPDAAALFEYISGASGALDEYSTYLTADQLDELYSQIEGNFVGLGIELKAVEGALAILRVIPGSPAERNGIQAGDRIVMVDDQTTEGANTDAAANMLQGPEGTTVDVTVVGPDGSPRKLSVRREHVEVPSVDETRIVDSKGGIGYLRLTSFQKTTSRDLDNALWDLHRQGMRSLVMDLRGNPGGLLTAAVEVADKFIRRGSIVSTKGRMEEEDNDYSAREQGTWRVPLVVLIDGDSASASEIFAGAIRDHRRGTIVGTRSYGKGSVQGIFPLNIAGGGIRLTTAKFYSPQGKAFSRVGVTPDVVVHVAARPEYVAEPTTEAPKPGDDPILAAGLRAARRKLASP